MTFFDSWDSYRIFERSVKERSRYIHTSDVARFLQALLESVAKRERIIHKGTILYRARIGHDSHNVGEKGSPLEIPGPLNPKKMKPLRAKSADGRVSPRGIPVLYVAEEQQTALSEVRPFKGEIVSLATLAVVRNLKVVDCRSERESMPCYLYFRTIPGSDVAERYEPDPEEREKVVWEYVDAAFSKPVGSHDKMLDYVPTQIIAEMFKQNGYDGIIYKSSLRKGTNIALFNINDARVYDVALFECSSIAVTCNEPDPQLRRRGPAYKRCQSTIAGKSKSSKN